ncbi:MAG: fused MFS/spermidine synthase [Verrucomicrobiota bacterium]|nr:fused MFS/spermidine synthase [Verrucomicrobiota bacterium]
MPAGRTIALGVLVFFGGFAVMVLEIVGARYLQPYFGGAFYVWTSQIGVVMLALAMGYAIGGCLADRSKRASDLGKVLIAAGIFILLIPTTAPKALDAIVDRHASDELPPRAAISDNEPASELVSELPPEFTLNERKSPLMNPALHEVIPEVSAIWRKIDPAMGSAVVFLLPCFALAMISPYIIRLRVYRLENIGTLSGTVYAASTAGSIGGVFVTAYVLIDHFSNTELFRITGLLTLGLAALCFALDLVWAKNTSKQSD